MKSEPADPQELIDHLKNALGLLASERELASHKTISIDAQLKEAAFMVKRVVQIALEPEVKISICLLWSYLVGCLDLCLYKQDCTIQSLNGDINFFV